MMVVSKYFAGLIIPALSLSACAPDKPVMSKGQAIQLAQTDLRDVFAQLKWPDYSISAREDHENWTITFERVPFGLNALFSVGVTPSGEVIRGFGAGPRRPPSDFATSREAYIE